MRIIRYILLFVMFSFPAYSADYYMANNPCSGNSGWGNGSNSNNGDKATPFLTLQYAMSQLSAGDTLTIDDGTYTGSTNVINNTYCPPISDTLWTTIQAENRGSVTFDGEGIREMFVFSGASTINSHWVFDGLVWGNSSVINVFLVARSYVKILNCGAFQAGPGSNVWNIAIMSYCDYILVEGCYTWGRGRASITAWCSSSANRTEHIIFRNCVGRIDVVTDGEPSYGFGMYSINHGMIQNCIAIDSDQTDYYYNSISGQNWAGGFSIPTTNYQADDITIDNSIVINSEMGGINITANNPANDVTINNVALLDVNNRDGISVSAFWGVNEVLNSMTFIDCNSDFAGINGWGGTTPHYINNSVITGYNLAQYLIYTMQGNYCNFYNNTGTVYGGSYTNSFITNPIWSISNTSGGLKYPVQIETGSNLDGTGSDGGTVGATILKQMGAPGTIWGEPGYNLLQDGTAGQATVELWPFQNEDIIKSKMQEYSYDGGALSGDRGFASSTAKQLDGTSDVTLTSYIWEYLGNEMPDDIYEGSTAPTIIINQTSGTTVTSSSFQITGTATATTGRTIASVTCAGQTVIIDDGTADELEEAFTINITLSEGLNTFTIVATDSEGDTDSVVFNVAYNETPVAGSGKASISHTGTKTQMSTTGTKTQITN